jgi:UDP-3-O-[3-hydroxymyristoyl] glucosamine N-acyltransferase
MASFSAQHISQCVQGTLSGSADLQVHGVEQLDRAGPDQISFVRAAKNIGAWQRSRARVVLVSKQLALTPDNGEAIIHVDSADLAMAIVLGLFAPPAVVPQAQVHANATVDPTAQLGDGVAIGPGCVIGAGVRVGDGCVLHAQVCVMDQTTLGQHCTLYPGVVIRERCQLGDNVIIHANSVIGADGFGYTPAADGASLVKIPHIGAVTIGNDVEIGANTCIDRGKHSDTTIGDGTKIDNLCQIAHNCRIGRHCLIAGQAGLAGSVSIGNGAVLGGNVGVKDQLHIGAGAQIAAYAAVMHNVPDGARWGGYPAQDVRQMMREIAVVRKLTGTRKHGAQAAARNRNTSD